MPDTRLTARARVQLMIDVESGSVWGANTTVDQVQRQAVDGAVGFIRRLLSEHGERRATIIGEPKVHAIITTHYTNLEDVPAELVDPQ